MKNRIEILPGVYLTSVQTEKFKTGCFSINFLQPMSRECASANALVPNVLLRGSGKYPDIRSISARLDELYGSSMGTLVRKKGEVQLVGFFADFIEDRCVQNRIFEPMMEFVAEILLHPVLENGAFAAAVVESEKRNLANTIESRINDKRSYAVSQLLRIMCADEVYGVPRLGELEDLERIDPANLYARYRDLLEHSCVECFYMGSQPEEKVADCLRLVLRDLPRGTYTEVGTRVVRRAESVRTEMQCMDVTQGKLAMGFRTGCTVKDPEYPAVLLMNAVFGGGITSKLFLKVREEMSLCYYAGSSLEKFKGVMVVSSGIEFDQYETARTAILEQLEQCRAGNISEYELESARRYLISDLKAGLDSPGRLDDYYMGQIMEGLDETMQQLSERLSRVTKEEVVEAAKRVTLDTVFFLKGVQA